MKKIKIFLVFLSCYLVSAQRNATSIIPLPFYYENTDEAFVLSSSTKLKYPKECVSEINLFKELLKSQTGIEFQNQSKRKGNTLEFSLGLIDEMNEEGYQLRVSNDKIEIIAASQRGIFYGIQSLLQLISEERNGQITIPGIIIKDKPKFSWRGMHLDVCRHFFSVSFIKKYIDYLAMLKINTFHWHLTEDQGWRIEIKKYPKLTEIGGWRKGTMIGPYKNQEYDTIKYGGFYTQDEIREVVAYAQNRHITIVPEIEMPGHALAALAAYPEFSCTGGPFEVAQKWGVFDEVFCPKEETFTFLENVLEEVMDLFPSKYIHIGGDECPKKSWKNCLHCQKLIKDKGLKDENELQSYFIKRIEKLLNKKGRQIIGWDEILEGGLAPNAAVMSWRGEEGGIEAAKQKHKVVMSPGGYCYFDHYQGTPINEPLAIGGYTPLEKVYEYKPVPNVLSEDEKKYIMGVQANVWTEYILNEKQVEYMIFPRIFALAEVAWGTNNTNEFEGFKKRVINWFPKLEKQNIRYSKALFEVKGKPERKAGKLFFSLQSSDSSGIYYVFNEKLLTKKEKYVAPFEIKESGVIQAAYFENHSEPLGTIFEQAIVFSKSTAKSVDLKSEPSSYYSLQKGFSLVDGILGDVNSHRNNWLGFNGKDFEVVIDFDKEEEIEECRIQFYNNPADWIYLPKEVVLEISLDGKDYNKISQINTDFINAENGTLKVKLPKTKARFLRVKAVHFGKIPDNQPGTGKASWLFVDEISVY